MDKATNNSLSPNAQLDVEGAQKPLQVENSFLRCLLTANSTNIALMGLFEIAGRELDVEMCEYWIPHSNKVMKREICRYPKSPEPQKNAKNRVFQFSIENDRGLIGQIWKSRKAQGLSLLEEPKSKDLSLTSNWGFPVIIDKKIVGIVLMHSRTFLPSEAMMKSFESIGEALADFILRQDVETKRESSRHSLKQANLLISMAQKAARCGVWSWNVQTDDGYWSPGYWELFGINPNLESNIDSNIRSNVGSIKTKHDFSGWLSSIHPDDRDRMADQAVRVIHDSNYDDWHVEYRVNHPELGERWLAGIGKIYRDHEGRAKRIIGINVDITDRKNYEQALQKSHQQKDKFLALLGHELRNPLGAIMSAIQILDDTDKQDPAYRQTLNILDRQSQHMSHLLDGLLDTARVVQGKMTLDRSTLNLNTLIEHLIQDRATEVKDVGLTVSFNAKGDPIWTTGDHTRLTQVFDSILSNSIKFSTPGGAIDISIERQHKMVEVKISDTGTGISKQILAHVFEPFQQSHQNLGRTSGGLGLGLAIAKGIVDLHCGEIDAYSEGIGKGTQVRVLLPLIKPAQQRVKLVNNKGPSEHNILVVEDNKDAGLLLKHILERNGHEVRVANSGEHGLELARQNPPDVILCDIGLPNMSGYDFAQAVRADHALEKIPLIAVTGYGQDTDRARSQEADFNGHLTKPITTSELFPIIDKLVGK